ncbi:MAG: protoporphyrinogen oxidase [Bryobacterales bacterium]|nr:protoporphyrinogen oxidase [Bryobacterales bacterium]
MSSSPKPVIVGGGISGLSAAYYLGKAGITPTVVEREPRLGGVITTEVVDGCVIEGGPDSFLAAKPAALELIGELGLAGEVIASNDDRRVTYILKGGRLVPLPDGLMMMVPTKVLPVAASSLLGWGTKIKMGLEYFRKPGEGSGRDRSVADFVREHYGQETVDYLAEPLLAGVYGGDPDRLSIVSTLPRFAEMEERYGSLTRGVLAARRQSANGGGGALFKTLKGGLGQLVEALRPFVPNVRQGEADALRAGGVRVDGQWVEASHIVLACPAPAAAKLVSSLDARLAELLAGIEYASSMTVAFGYRREELRHPLNGFGFLVPKRERRSLVACTWVGTKFPFRVPDTHAVLRCFAQDGAEVEALHDDLQRIMGFQARPAFTRVSRWPRSMAQYTVGHGARIQEIRERLKAHPWLHLAGNAYEGIGIPDCIRLGREAAHRIATR